ncbi:hypothetical protein [Leptolyngbya ohadii]|uniref:hypothetical protein n=1 Tax=Leptolyngbya ohadii TaxID=1962290 RepID=UPI0015C6525F|nr:hypothetical protein [Leptolyngbya ohadii]
MGLQWELRYACLDASPVGDAGFCGDGAIDLSLHDAILVTCLALSYGQLIDTRSPH